MSVAMIQAVRMKRRDGRLLLHFRKLDSETRRPSGRTYISSPLVGIEVVEDAYGAMMRSDDACVVLRTATGSVYLAILKKTLVNQINRAIIATGRGAGATTVQ